MSRVAVRVVSSAWTPPHAALPEDTRLTLVRAAQASITAPVPPSGAPVGQSRPVMSCSTSVPCTGKVKSRWLFLLPGS